MMHLQDFISFISVKRQPVREYNPSSSPIIGANSRDCDIYLAPGTEYEFGFKNQCYKRRRVNIFIDGTKAVDSLIIDAWQHLHLERFFDTDKKFMTALKGDSRVSDPTNSSIGKIRIEVYKEDVPDRIEPAVKTSGGVLLGNPRNTPRNKGGMRGGMRSNSGLLRSMDYSAGGSADFQTPTATVYSCSAEPTLGITEQIAPSSLPSNLATIEGGKSNQKLVTVTWGGDNVQSLQVFNFNLLEKNAELQNLTHKFCTSCGTKSDLNHNFCAKCGKKF
ncbi:hypothetical protein CCP1ISM_160010 [Azospirillaceae bacterium]